MAHSDLPPCAERHVPGRKDCLTPQARLDIFPCANRHVHATTLLHSHAVSTPGSLSVRKEACSGEKSAAFSRREHSWISLRAQDDMFMRQHCCVRTLSAHLDPIPCAKKHVPAKILLRSHAASTFGSRPMRKEKCSIERLLRSHAASTLGSLSVRKQEDMFMRPTAAFARPCTFGSFSVRKGTCSGRTTSCVLTPRTHLDLAPCARRHVSSKSLLRSRNAPQDR